MSKIIIIKLIFLIQSLLLFIKSDLIIIPLKKYIYDYDNESSISEIYSNIYYTELLIGEPSQKIIAFINTTEDSNIGIYNKYCDSKFYLNDKNISKNYNYENSITFNQIGEGDMKSGKKDILIKEQINFYSNFELTKNIKVENMSILYNPNNEEYILDDVGYDFIIEKEKKATCGYIGLRLGTNYQSINNNLVRQLKEKEIISNTIFTFLEVNKKNEKYKKNNIEYLLVIGEEIHDIFNLKDINIYISEKYNKNFYKEKIKINDYILNDYYFRWKLTFSDIYFNMDNNIRNLEQMKNIFLDNDYGVICGTNEYKQLIIETFFKKYINISKCSEKTFSTYNIGSFYYYVCDNDINIKNFPSLSFKSKNLQYEYKLNKDNLFIKDNNKIYFLIVFQFSKPNTWTLGRPFLEKYLFSYNYDSKLISFYNENLLEGKIENNIYMIKYIILIFAFLLFVSLIFGFLLGRYIYYEKKRKKALELDDSLNYNYENDELKNKEKQNILNIN